MQATTPTHDLGDLLFAFAVISDSHVNEGEDQSASPYASNKQANARFRYLVRSLNRHRPEFTIHLGDMVNPLPELATYEPAVQNFNALVDDLESPLHLVAGNHCVGDKPTGWVPVPRICTESISQFEQFFGRDFYSFDHGSCHFSIVSSLLIGSGTERENSQRQWLEEDLAQAQAAGQRLWIMMHYPLYVAAPGEPGSYDNVDEPGRSWLLDLFARHQVEAAFSGHVHNFFYNRHGETDMYTVPAPSFVRQDYGELYGVAPEDREGGRNDTIKLGYFLVHVHERGHATHPIRTWGRSLAEDEPLAKEQRIPSIHPRTRRPLPIGSEVRENWLARMAFMTNNSVSPFTRRLARNDWPLFALTEMGVCRLRIFLQELENPAVVERMVDLNAAGYKLLVYTYGLPNPREYSLIRDHHELLAGWELIIGLDQIEALATGLEKLALHLPNDHDLPCYLSEVRDIHRGQVDDANVKHIANYGFQVQEDAHIEQLLQAPTIRDTFAGFVFRLRRREKPQLEVETAIRHISEIGARSSRRHQVHLLFSGNITAEPFVDDLRTANRVAEAVFATALAGNVDLWLDTFEDSDRGYFVRHGLVDRLYNPRLAARVVGHLNSVLASRDLTGMDGCRTQNLPGIRILTVELVDGFLALVLPAKSGSLDEMDAPGKTIPKLLKLIDLGSGLITESPVQSVKGRLRFEKPLVVESPLWIEAKSQAPHQQV